MSTRSDFIQNHEVCGRTVPYPCTGKEDMREENPDCPEIDTTRFATTIDRIIIEALNANFLAADIYRGVLYSPITGRVLKTHVRESGYAAVALNLKPHGRIVWLPVHRIVWYAAHPGEVLGQDFDVHHIDGNKQNNAVTNLQKVPRKFHSLTGAFSNIYEAEAGYLAYLNAKKHGAGFDADAIRAMRVCERQLPHGSNRKKVIYDYFADKMHTSREYCKNLTRGHAGRSILPATPDEEEQILKDYAWLIEQAKNYPYQRNNGGKKHDC